MAENVCSACSARKKACDKALPACGFCADRNLVCRYVTPRSRRGYRAYNPGRHFVAIDTSCPSTVPPHAEIKSYQSTLPRNPCDLDFPRRFRVPPASSSIDEYLYQQTSDITSLINLPADEVGDCYFQTFQQWHPIMSPERFREVLHSHESSIPPADSSALFLAIYLIIMLQKLEPESPAAALSRERLYLTTKSVFAQAQAALCTSAHLVQAIILIASCEYASGRLEAAYISLRTCSSLAQVLRIRGSVDVSTDRQRRGNTKLAEEEAERRNMSWAIAMLQTITLADLDQRDQLPLTEYPSLDSPLSQVPCIDISTPYTTSDWQAADLSQFEWQREAVSLLNRVLRLPRPSSGRGRTVLSELAELDISVQDLLSRVINEDSERVVSMRNAVALCVRTLFLLHRVILDILRSPKSDDEYQAVQRSRAALSTACEMVIDSARCFGQKPDTAPICCYYNLRAAIQYLEETGGGCEDASCGAMEYLLRAEEVYRSRWVF